VVPMMEEEQYGRIPGCGGEGRADGAVPGRGDAMEAVEVMVVWTRWHRRGHGKF
jgi:hypothetical protein